MLVKQWSVKTVTRWPADAFHASSSLQPALGMSESQRSKIESRSYSIADRPAAVTVYSVAAVYSRPRMQAASSGGIALLQIKISHGQ